MIISLLLSFLLSTFLGVALSINIYFERPLRSLVLWASPLMGIGVSGLLYFLWSLAFYPTFAPALYFGLELLAALAGTFIFLRRRRGKVDEAVIPESKKLHWTEKLLGVVFILMLAYLVVLYIQRIGDSPYGEWDAWAIWNMRARYIFLGGEHWENAFSRFLHGSDYPVLISFYIARCWTFAGSAPQIVPQALGSVYAFATFGFLWEAVRRARGMLQGLVAGILLASTPSFLFWSASQYADVPLSAYILVSIAFLYYASTRQERDPGLLVLSGLLAGLALWSKNEGVFLLAGMIAALAVTAWVGKQNLPSMKSWAWILAGLLPPLLLLIGFKTFVVPPNYVFDQSLGAIYVKITDVVRYKTILKAFWGEIFVFGEWVIPVIPLLVLYSLAAGFDRQFIRREKRGLLILTIILGTLLAGYMFAYLVTPLPLDWQIRQSIDRLLLQGFPGALFWLFLVLRNPLAAERSSHETSFAGAEVHSGHAEVER
jgi:hypothetical protein